VAVGKNASLEVDTRQIQALFREMGKSAAPEQTKKYLKNVGNIILRQEDLIFKTRGSLLTGVRWRALSEATKKRNPRRKGGIPLMDTGILRASVSGGRGKGSIRSLRKFSITIGTNLDYAPTHQFGRRRMKAQVRAHTRRLSRKKTGGLRKSSLKRGRALTAFVRPYTTTLPAIPARKFVGWTRQGIKQSVQLAGEFFVVKPSQKSAKVKP
jgi:phage gpG-like protein